ncbi:hypothetical protein [Bradyrhizobium sp. Arg816]|uniref:hypothetical protein n=1 Tax=Bradyrhizobium sp. Arg816 TaxID=2998491 RepID=UPI00249EC291|nr:hypothetical protein [Bradyrhizobium sp. Arg816]MDI3559551.1 hypothetical protein [Bradyrhizobium sp. Arg816]
MSKKFAYRNGADESTMAEYRLYRVDKEGHISEAAVIVSCEDDDAAIAEAKQYVDGVAIEVWDRDRRVAVLPSTE